MSEHPSSDERGKKAERKRFEGWMRRYWAGVPLRKLPGHKEEYTESQAQTAWEAWWHLTRKRS